MNKLQLAEAERAALIEMYKAGFLDGFNWTKAKNRKFKEVQHLCKKAFEFRFIKKIQRGLKKCSKKKQ